MSTADRALVRLRDVTKRYAPTAPAALAGVDLDIARGEILGVIGESGAGKSTMLQLIAGLTTATSGAVSVDGVDVAGLDRRGLRRLRRDIGVVFQGIHLLSSKTVRANVALPLQLAAPARGRAARRAQRTAVDEILAFVGLADRADAYPAQLSGGQQQRVGLARALVTRPALLLCDEPTSSLDTTTTADVLRVIADARTKLGTTVVVITHDLDVVKAICDRAALFERGALTEVFPVDAAGYRALPSYREQVARELAGPDLAAPDEAAS